MIGMVSTKDGPKGFPDNSIDMTSGAVRDAAAAARGGPQSTDRVMLPVGRWGSIGVVAGLGNTAKSYWYNSPKGRGSWHARGEEKREGAANEREGHGAEFFNR